MLKTAAKHLAQSVGLHISSLDRLGATLEHDLTRLTAGAPLEVIFDVGANFGQTAVRFSEAFPRARIYSFEPVPSSYARLKAAVAQLPRVTPIDSALGDAPGTAQIHITGDAASNSLHAISSATGAIEIKVDTVDAVADARGLSNIDLLKIDVEGYELSVLKGAHRRLNDGLVRFVYAECVFSPNQSMPHTSFFDLHRLLEAAGFCFVSYYAESFHLSLGCAMGNVLWARRASLPESAPGKVRNII